MSFREALKIVLELANIGLETAPTLAKATYNKQIEAIAIIQVYFEDELL